MKFFERYDERSQAIENAGGNLAFKIFWVAMLLSLAIIILISDSNTEAAPALKLVFILIIFEMATVLCAKYYYGWTHTIDRKLLIVKFSGTVLGSIIYVLMLAVIIKYLRFI